MAGATAALVAPLVESVEAAREAGLRYSSDAAPGIRRRRAGRGFVYLGPDNVRVRDSQDLARIRALAIPPAWTGVWICPHPRGHLQATGRDARGRKQYRYHADWRTARDENKYGRLIDFAAALPRIRGRVSRDLRRPGLPREKMLAAVVRLLETTHIRVGNDEYARQNRSFGLTTLRAKHVVMSSEGARFRFRGKSGKEHVVQVMEPALVRIIRQCNDLPGDVLFEYEEAGDRGSIGSGDVNAYLREITGEGFTAKDFRTWAGTVLAARALRARRTPRSARAAKADLLGAIDFVAEQLGNTRAVCRRCYIHPAIVDGFSEGTLTGLGPRAAAKGGRPRMTGLRAEEAAVVALLRRAMRAQRSGATRRA